MDPRFKTPFTCIINGPSKSGKTMFIDYVLKNQRDCTTVEDCFDALAIWYQNWQPVYETWASLAPVVYYYAGLPEKNWEEKFLSLFDNGKQNCLILDDVDVPEKDYSKFMTRLFTVYSHHKNISVFYATHHLFLPNRHSVVLTRNADYLVLLASPRDKSAIRTLGYQCMPKTGGADFLLSAYETATSNIGGKLICDWTQNVPEELRFRESISISQPIVCYRKKKNEENKHPMTNKRHLSK